MVAYVKGFLSGVSEGTSAAIPDRESCYTFLF